MRTLLTNVRTLFAAAIVAAGLFAAPALAEPERETDRAFEATRDGRSMPLPQLERRILPFMGGADYLGPEMRGSNVRMKFLDRGKVIWVDVDPKTGRILGKSDD